MKKWNVPKSIKYNTVHDRMAHKGISRSDKFQYHSIALKINGFETAKHY